jgi:hypothetical protein
MKQKLVLLLIIILTSLGCGKQKEDLQGLIGLNINSKPFQAYLNKLEIAAEISRYDDSYYYTFKTKGIEIIFTNSDIIGGILLFSEGSDGHRQYQGKIPYNIHFTDTRRDIEQKLGPPEKNGGNGVINYYSSWNKEGLKLTITYKKSNQEDMDNRIHDIALSKWSN